MAFPSLSFCFGTDIVAACFLGSAQAHAMHFWAGRGRQQAFSLSSSDWMEEEEEAGLHLCVPGRCMLSSRQLCTPCTPLHGSWPSCTDRQAAGHLSSSSDSYSPAFPASVPHFSLPLHFALYIHSESTATHMHTWTFFFLSFCLLHTVYL